MIVLESWDELPAYLRRLADKACNSMKMRDTELDKMFCRGEAFAYMTLAEELENGELKVRYVDVRQIEEEGK